MDDSALLADAKFIVPQVAMASTDMHSSKIIGEDIGVHQLDVAIMICAEQSDVNRQRSQLTSLASRRLFHTDRLKPTIVRASPVRDIKVPLG
jgi:hypothetical protein